MLPPIPANVSAIPVWLDLIRQSCPEKKKVAYWHTMIDTYKIPLVKPEYPTCYFTSVVLTNDDVDVCFFNNQGVNKLGADKRFKPSRLAKKYTGDFAPMFVWCHRLLSPLIDEIQTGRFYKSQSKLVAEPHDYFVTFTQRLMRMVKKESIPQTLGVKNFRPKKEAPAEAAQRVSPATPPLGTPSTSPFQFAHPVTDTEYTNWVSTLTFNYWNERDLILHFLGTPKNGFVPKSQFVAMMDALFTQAEMSAPSLLAAIKSRFPHKDWGHQGIETGWVDFREK